MIRRHLEAVLAKLDEENQAFDRAAEGWSKDSAEAKKRTRRDREMAYLQLRVALARLGEVDLLLRLDKLPFGRRIEELGRFVREGAAAARPSESFRRPNAGGSEDGRAHT